MYIHTYIQLDTINKQHKPPLLQLVTSQVNERKGDMESRVHVIKAVQELRGVYADVDSLIQPDRKLLGQLECQAVTVSITSFFSLFCRFKDQQQKLNPSCMCVCVCVYVCVHVLLSHQ